MKTLVRRTWLPLLLFAGSVFAAEPLVLPSRGICAHRGGGGTENTLVALQEAVRLGAHMVEFDIAITRDGTLVLMHDTTVNRTTDGTGKVIDLTLAELKRLDAGVKTDARFAGTRVPTLVEALAVLPRNIWINVDFKADARFAGKRPRQRGKWRRSSSRRSAWSNRSSRDGETTSLRPARWRPRCASATWSESPTRRIT